MWPRPTILVPDRRTTRSMIVRWPRRRSFVQFVRRTKLVNVFSYYLFFLYIHYCRIYLSIKSLRCADTKMLSSSAFTFYTHVRYRLSTRSNGYARSLYRVFSKSGATTEQATIRRGKSKSKLKNKVFAYEASFSRKTILKIHLPPVYRVEVSTWLLFLFVFVSINIGNIIVCFLSLRIVLSIELYYV